MKIGNVSWHKLLAFLCAFVFLLMVYRREARMRANINNLEGRIAALESYVYDKAHNRAVEIPAQVEQKMPSPDQTIPDRPHREQGSSAPKSVSQTPAASSQSHIAQMTMSSSEESGTGKFKQVVRLELNTIDSATLVRVPGIGEGTARTILFYREKLGGFYSSQQLREKLTWEGAQKNLDQWCNEWFWADEYFVRKLYVNKLSFKELLNHPYLEFDDVKAIMRWKDKHGAVHSRADLEQLGISDSVKLEKLLHYVEF